MLSSKFSAARHADTDSVFLCSVLHRGYKALFAAISGLAMPCAVARKLRAALLTGKCRAVLTDTSVGRRDESSLTQLAVAYRFAVHWRKRITRRAFEVVTLARFHFRLAVTRPAQRNKIGQLVSFKISRKQAKWFDMVDGEPALMPAMLACPVVAIQCRASLIGPILPSVIHRRILPCRCF